MSAPEGTECIGFVTDTASRGHSAVVDEARSKEICDTLICFFLTGLKDVKTFSRTSSRVFFPQEEM